MIIEDMKLTSFACVVHAEDPNRHEPYSLHHGFLISRGVVPNDWEVEEVEMNPLSARLRYENGVILFMDDSSFQVHQEQERDWGEGNDTVGVSVRYLTSVNQKIFDASSIHWVAHIPSGNSNKCLTDHFLSPRVVPEKWKDFFTLGLSFRIRIDEMEMYFRISSVQTTSNDEAEQEFISVGCGVYKDGFEDCTDLIGWLSEWREHERKSFREFESLMEVRNDGE